MRSLRREKKNNLKRYGNMEEERTGGCGWGHFSDMRSEKRGKKQKSEEKKQQLCFGEQEEHAADKRGYKGQTKIEKKDVGRESGVVSKDCQRGTKKRGERDGGVGGCLVCCATDRQ